MNKLITELELRIKINMDLAIDDQENSVFYADKINILKEYLAFVEKVEKEIDRKEKRYRDKDELKERIFNNS